MSNKIRIIKDVAGTTAKVEGIDVKPLPLNSYLCSVTAGNGGITIFNPESLNDTGSPTKVFSNVPYTEFVKADGSVIVTEAVAVQALKSVTVTV